MTMRNENSEVDGVEEEKETVRVRSRGQAEKDALLKIGETIRAKRKEKGYSLVRMASNLDVSSTYLCDVEKGRRNFSVAFLTKVCKELGITLKDAVKEAGPELNKKRKRRRA